MVTILQAFKWLFSENSICGHFHLFQKGTIDNMSEFLQTKAWCQTITTPMMIEFSHATTGQTPKRVNNVVGYFIETLL